MRNNGLPRAAGFDTAAAAAAAVSVSAHQHTDNDRQHAGRQHQRQHQTGNPPGRQQQQHPPREQHQLDFQHQPNQMRASFITRNRIPHPPKKYWRNRTTSAGRAGVSFGELNGKTTRQCIGTAPYARGHARSEADHQTRGELLRKSNGSRVNSRKNDRTAMPPSPSYDPIWGDVHATGVILSMGSHACCLVSRPRYDRQGK